MKFSSILKKINFKSRKSMLKTGAILFWTDMKRLFNWNMDNFKSNFLSRGQLGSKSNDKFFLSVLKMWQCCKYFFGNLIFALTARTLSGNRLNILICSSEVGFLCRHDAVYSDAILLPTRRVGTKRALSNALLHDNYRSIRLLCATQDATICSLCIFFSFS